MYQIQIDLSEIEALEKRAEEELGRTARIMKAVADIGALNERRDHAYHNRTGNLQRSTGATIEGSSISRVEVDLEMGMEYASYVVRRGLSTVEKQAAEVASGIEIALEAQAERIAGK